MFGIVKILKIYNWRAINFYEHGLHLIVDLRIASFPFYAFFGALYQLLSNKLV